MLTVKDLEQMEPHEQFLKGILTGKLVNCSPDISDSRLTVFVAVRGGIADWAIYTRYIEAKDMGRWKIEDLFEDTARHGEKLWTESAIRWLVPCTDEAWKRYRF